MSFTAFFIAFMSGSRHIKIWTILLIYTDLCNHHYSHIMKGKFNKNGPILISDSLLSIYEDSEDDHQPKALNKIRLFYISMLAILTGAAISFIAKILVALINFFTNLSFYGTISTDHSSPWQNHLGIFVIAIPVIGGLAVGLMAFYGSKAIRGHGIPEAMEQILTNDSRIKPSITFLKPVSSAISIGTGGPFGAEGPIIATGGALGSLAGQLLKITSNERKILLAAGAAAGMSAIFGSPLAAILLAIELLLFEFSPRSLVPVALACITGAAGHNVFFESGPVFSMSEVMHVSSTPLFIYSLLGIVIGFIATVITKAVYIIEDAFEELPIHWMWWPAIGGLAVGICGYYAPRTLGVGYENITGLLSGSLPITLLITLSVIKFISWSVSPGSGTSGGTLAPLLTIGAATGSLMGILVLSWFPECGITIPLAALIGMSAMFAGASRAMLTSIVFALETTQQSNALVPLIASCSAAYLVSMFFMENTIMTEKIARRGVQTPDSYEPDMLEKILVRQILKTEPEVLSDEITVGDARIWLRENEEKIITNHFVVTNENANFRGIVNLADICNPKYADKLSIIRLLKNKPIFIYDDNTLRIAVNIMAREDIEMLPVVSRDNKSTITGILSYKDILSAYKFRISEFETRGTAISMKRQLAKPLIWKRKIMGK